MGLLRPQGLLTGTAWVEDWEMLGYEVILSNPKLKEKSLVNAYLTTEETITLKRSEENSLNPMAQLWKKPLIEFEAIILVQMN